MDGENSITLTEQEAAFLRVLVQNIQGLETLSTEKQRRVRDVQSSVLSKIKSAEKKEGGKIETSGKKIN